ncbi:hypothetical protein [Actinorugispora endophytica]|uniref:Uncharacterized protein n=1 Tax=Actinorugispora endophytica TaxID=1605990 RepID=A0A4R6UXR7_9ACTN|nr:hypothetical protein [Actinorugispora endophytica]TDQ52058.1 hypothetical protein EV190_10839 [Actinorugispora endophytica]
MTEPFDDRFEERLRAALRAEADSTPTSHDALERIRARTERRLLPWSGLAWLRPAVAVGAAALIAGSVLLSTPQIRDHVLPESFVSAAESHRAETEQPPPEAAADPSDGSGVRPGGSAAAPVPPPAPSPVPSPEEEDEDGEGESPALSCAASPPPEPSPDTRSDPAPESCPATDAPGSPEGESPAPGGDEPDDGTAPESPPADDEEPSPLPEESKSAPTP